MRTIVALKYLYATKEEAEMMMCPMCILGWGIGVAVLILLIVVIVKLLRK